MKSKRLIVVSLDALSSIDFDMFSKLPNFKKFIRHAACCRQVRSVYPSLTYPAHTSIVTGRTPAHHGIVNNILLQPERSSPDWYWQRNYIRGTTLYDEVLKQGKHVAALLWPVTAKSEITWNLPEIFANRRWTNQILTSAANGTVGYQLMLNHRFGRLRDGIRQPALDNFVHASLKYTLKTYRPDLTLVHFTDLDTQRHHYGVHSEEAAAAIKRHDERIGELMHLLHQNRMSVKRDTTVIILGDHSQLDVRNVILINKLLREQGYLKVQNGRVTEWKAYCQNCDGSAYIYIKKEGMDRDEYLRVKNGVYDWLCAMKNEPDKVLLRFILQRKQKSWERILNVHLCWRQDAAFIFRMNWIQQRFRTFREQLMVFIRTEKTIKPFLWLWDLTLFRGWRLKRCLCWMRGRRWLRLWDFHYLMQTAGFCMRYSKINKIGIFLLTFA